MKRRILAVAVSMLVVTMDAGISLAADSVYGAAVGDDVVGPETGQGSRQAGRGTRSQAGTDQQGGSSRGQSDSVNDPRTQASGNYPNYQRSGTSGDETPLGQLQKAWINPVPAPGQESPGLMHYEVSSTAMRTKVMRVRARRYMTTTMTLPACETVEDMYLGDPRLFRVKSPRDNTVLVYPRQEGGDSDLTLITKSGRRFYFVLIAEGVNSKWVPDIAVEVDFDDPDACSRRQFETSRNEMDGLHASRSADENQDYAKPVGVDWAHLDMRSQEFSVYVGRPEDAEIAPEAVGTDHRSMFLDFGRKARSMRWPAVYLRVDGHDELVESRPIGENGQIMQVMAYGELTLKTGAGDGSGDSEKERGKIVCIRLNPRMTASRTRGGIIIDQDLGRGR